MTNRHRIEIDRLRVVRQAAMESAYTAVKRADADELFDTVPIVEADDEMLAAIWMSSCAQLLAFLRTHLRRNDGFVLSARYDADGFHACLAVQPERPNGPIRRCASDHPIADAIHRVPTCCTEGLEELGQVLDTAMAAYLSKDILAGWMSMALPEREPACRAAAEQVLLSMEQVIVSFRRPLRVRKRMEVV